MSSQHVATVNAGAQIPAASAFIRGRQRSAFRQRAAAKWIHRCGGGSLCLDTVRPPFCRGGRLQASGGRAARR